MPDRTPHTDALATLGMIHTKQEYRDAIHLGVEPVTTNNILLKGQYLVWNDKDKRIVKATFDNDPNAIGIVDPFLDKHVDPGEWFWLILLPRQITSLRHVWEHPKFPKSELESDEGPTDASVHKELARLETIIQEYVDDMNADHYSEDYKEDYGVDPLTFDELISTVIEGDTINKGPMFSGMGSLPGRVASAIKEYVELKYGLSVDADDFYFTCYC